jgi:hypothetical protein
LPAQTLLRDNSNIAIDSQAPRLCALGNDRAQDGVAALIVARRDLSMNWLSPGGVSEDVAAARVASQ